MSPQGVDRGYAVECLNRLLVFAYDRSGFAVRPATTSRAGPRSAPEPDFSAVPSAMVRLHDVGDAALVVEVSDSWLHLDRRTKRRIYAHAGAPCYWIVEIPSRRVRVLTDPHGDDYGDEHIAGEGDVPSLPVVGVEIPVAEILPPPAGDPAP